MPSRRMRLQALFLACVFLTPVLLGAGSPAPVPTASAEVAAHPIKRPDSLATGGSLFRGQAGGPSSSRAFWVSGASLVLLLAAVGALSWVARRWRLITPRAGGPLSVISRTQLTPRHTIHLVQAGGRTLLIGTGTGGSPTLLGQWEPGQAPEFDRERPGLYVSGRVDGGAA